MRYAIQTGSAVLGGLIGFCFGQLDGLLYALLAVMALDYLSGVIVAALECTLSSRVGFRGLAKKLLILAVVIVGNLVDAQIIGSGALFRNAVICFYLANEGLSILENAGKLGIPALGIRPPCGA